MKKFITLLALAAGFSVLTPATAAAGDRSPSHNCRDCSAPVYRESCIVGYDSNGQPLYGLKVSDHSCEPGCGGHGGRGGFNRGNGGIGNGGNDEPGCGGQGGGRGGHMGGHGRP